MNRMLLSEEYNVLCSVIPDRPIERRTDGGPLSSALAGLVLAACGPALRGADKCGLEWMKSVHQYFFGAILWKMNILIEYHAREKIFEASKGAEPL